MEHFFENLSLSEILSEIKPPLSINAWFIQGLPYRWTEHSILPISTGALLQILLGRGHYIDFSTQLKFAKIEFYGAFHL